MVKLIAAKFLNLNLFPVKLPSTINSRVRVRWCAARESGSEFPKSVKPQGARHMGSTVLMALGFGLGFGREREAEREREEKRLHARSGASPMPRTGCLTIPELALCVRVTTPSTLQRKRVQTHQIDKSIQTKKRRNACAERC